MTRAELRKLFQRHWGAGSEIARRAGRSRQTVSRWLNSKKGHESPEIEKAARELAVGYLAIERCGEQK